MKHRLEQDRHGGPRREPVALDRRQLLRSAGVAALGAMTLGAQGCPLRREPQTAALAPVPELPTGGRAGWAGAGGGRFARVNVAADREIRTIVGLRPFRATGFRVEVERLEDKLLVHNYGHGGGGITLSWGSSHLAMEEALQAVSETGLSSGWGDAPNGGASVARPRASACAVIGCGVMGLSTAILMQRHGWQVTIYTKDVPPHTTSNIAGGLWEPYSVSDPGRGSAAYQDQFLRATRLAHRYFQEMVGDDYSVRWIENFNVSNAPQPQPWFEAGTEDLYPRARTLTPDEHPFSRAHAFAFQTMLIEPHAYLNALMRDFLAHAGQIVLRDFSDRADVAMLTEPLIFNCTGLGAKDLVEDDEMDPIRGQLTFLLPQPEVDYSVIGGGLYMFPRSDGILLGGTFERGSWSTEPDPVAKQRIIQGHREIFGWDAAPVRAPSSGDPNDRRAAGGF